MRIGFDAKRAFNNYSGLGNYSRYVINNICKFYPENEYLLYTPGIPDLNIFSPPENSRVVKPGNLMAKYFRSYWRTFRINHWLGYGGVKIYHGLSNELPNGIHRNGVRSLITIHDLIFLRLPDMYRAFDRYTYKRKVEYGVKAADRIIAVSNQTRNDIIDLLNVEADKIEVVYQGCNQAFYERLDDENLQHIRGKYALPENYLLSVGTIEERKNLLNTIKAIHLGKIDLPLIVVGRKTAYFATVMKYINQYGLNQVRFLENVPASDLPAIYQSATGFIYPSSYEGFGIPVIEALNSGVPVVTSRGGCLEETAGNGGILADPGNIEELTEAIRRITEDSAFRDQLIRGGREHVLKFREINTIPALYNLYLSCL